MYQGLGPTTTLNSPWGDLRRISSILSRVSQAISHAKIQALPVSHKRNGDPVTPLDHEIDSIIRSKLPFENEGWLSEESQDDLQRLQCERVWVVDPIDGTRELVAGIPEWCVSIGLVEKSRVVAGGILNPCTGEMFSGSLKTGLKTLHLAGLPTGAEAAGRQNGSGIRTHERVLISRKEYGEGKWNSFERRGIKMVPVGSIAYRLALVAAGFAGATCTFEPRSEWDIAAGVALVQASGGTVQTFSGMPVVFNSRVPRVETLCAFSKECSKAVRDLLSAAA